MNIQQIAQDFNQREKRAMTFDEALEVLAKAELMSADEYGGYYEAAELMAQSIRDEYEAKIKVWMNVATDHQSNSRKKDKEIAELKERMNNIVDRAGNAW